MQRREFITLLGGAAATWPFAARAQQPSKVPRIGVLIALAQSATGNVKGLIGLINSSSQRTILELVSG